MATRFASEGLFETSTPNDHIIHFETAADFLEKFQEFKDNNDYLIQVANKGHDYYDIHFNNQKILEKRISIY